MTARSGSRRATLSVEERMARRAERAVSRQAEIDEDPVGAARQVCLDQLAVSARTRVQLERVLTRKGIPADAAASVLDRFTELGLVDDRAYAHLYVESQHRSRGLGRRALAQNLRQRGVDEELVREASEVVDGELERETAASLVRRRLPSLAAHQPDVQVRRLAGLLARKGYPPGLVYEVIREELRAVEVDADAVLGDGPGDDD